jgi:hypothetical protein
MPRRNWCNTIKHGRDGLPFANMWADDNIWFEPVLNGSKVKASFPFGDNDVVLDSMLKEVEIFVK